VCVTISLLTISTWADLLVLTHWGLEHTPLLVWLGLVALSLLLLLTAITAALLFILTLLTTFTVSSCKQQSGYSALKVWGSAVQAHKTGKDALLDNTRQSRQYWEFEQRQNAALHQKGKEGETNGGKE